MIPKRLAPAKLFRARTARADRSMWFGLTRLGER